MAIKTSNQITFTEQKKILEIKEWYLATDQSSDVTFDTEGWTEEVQTINETNKYLWNYEEVIYSIGSSEKSDPVIIGFYGKGTDGKGITDIKNYYFITQNPELPDNPEWSETVLMLTSTDKYLWNYDKIIYTDGTSKTSDPAIIGVYGDSGADAVDFQIYSVDGFEFNDYLTSIELKTVVFQNGQEITSDISYQWKWWNGESVEDDKYESIESAILPTLTVNSSDFFAFASLKCEVVYDGIVYEDYVSLTQKTSIYTAIAKFFNGSNIITTDDDYLIAYIELYKDNVQEEVLYTNNVYKSNENIVRDDMISTDIDGTYEDGDMMYFVCKNTDDDIAEYDTVLGQYESGNWAMIPFKYTYTNDLFVNSTSPVLFIPKEKISKALNLNFEIKENDVVIARTTATVLDLNDPVVSRTSPTDPQVGQLWLNTSTSPSILKMWDGSAWVDSGYQNGNVVYTSKPKNGYSSGDLWILADGEACGDYGPGSMLKSTIASSVFDKSHWVDAIEQVTTMHNDIYQTFGFSKDDEDGNIKGLTIGQTDGAFYVNITSTEMGFYDASKNKVVSIGNQSATIKNLTVQDGAFFDCEVHFGDFILKTESNGSLSLA